ncbi:innexin inx2 [Eurytemora carolleeae]|uniref:innexin inx2 n=1 Tax=Eurytemora carolleeae TaxID=1294199 RepID=UPI000C7772A1|nr:innexin inx2 [Eurytemora carolleeae]|eukprot:XP_023340611.1 innexin inx2-like [Eurytemora affinis]
MVTFSQFFGNPISCIVAGDVVPVSVMNTYCWIHSTFTLPKMEVGYQMPHPGVGALQEDTERYETRYYQWVCFTLFFQALFFLAPYQLWKYWEAGKVSRLIPRDLTHAVSDPRMPFFATPYNLVQKQKLHAGISEIKDYFKNQNARDYIEQRYFLYKFTVCEILNFVNVLFQIYFVNYFLGGVFSTYGSDVISVSQEDPELRNDAMDKVFPKVAKCTFERYGPSGTIENADGLCLLPLNILNEKIYIVLWFWFIALATVSGVQLVWRMGTLFSRTVRTHYLRRKSYLSASEKDVTTVCNNITLGDWFILILISENIDAQIFSELVRNKLSLLLNYYS